MREVHGLTVASVGLAGFITLSAGAAVKDYLTAPSPSHVITLEGAQQRVPAGTAAIAGNDVFYLDGGRIFRLTPSGRIGHLKGPENVVSVRTNVIGQLIVRDASGHETTWYEDTYKGWDVWRQLER